MDDDGPGKVDGSTPQATLPASEPASPPLSAVPPPPADAPAAPRTSWLDRIPGWVVPALLVGIPLLAWAAAQLWPQFYGQVIWQYYWGPIHADVAGSAAECLLPDGTVRPGSCIGATGIETRSGYNPINTGSWAVLLGLCIVGTGQLLRRFKAEMDSRLIVSATLWVVAGSIFHVLEDGKLFALPLAYFFITPIIYLLFAAFGVASFVIGHYLRVVAERGGIRLALQKMWLLVVVPVLLFLLLDLRDWGQVHFYLNPVFIALFAVAAFALASWRFLRLGRIEPNEFVGYMSVGWILAGLAYVFVFATGPWASYPGSPNPIPLALLAPLIAAALALAFRYAPARLWAGVAIVLGAAILPLAAYIVWDLLAGRLAPGLRPQFSESTGLLLEAVAFVSLVAAGFWWVSRRWAGLAGFAHAAQRSWVNVLILFAQMTDAFATSIGIDLGGYHEKHVFSKQVIDWTRDLGDHFGVAFLSTYPTFIGFASVKLLVSLLVVYAIDVSNPKEAQRNPTLIGLVKFAVIMVGIGPGVRDFVRMALGI